MEWAPLLPGCRVSCRQLVLAWLKAVEALRPGCRLAACSALQGLGRR